MRWRAHAVVAAGVLLAAAPAAAQTSPLKPGVLLYAAPGIGDPRFQETIVLLVRYDRSTGAMGLIVNQPTRVNVSDVVSSVKGGSSSRLPVYFGGPVEPDGIIGLLRPSQPLLGLERVLEGVYLARRMDDLAPALAAPDAEDHVRIYGGHSGWAPGQLEMEMRLGLWVVSRGDPDKVFSRDPSRLWEEVYQLLERTQAQR